MSTGLIVTIVILVILIGVAVALYFFGKRTQTRQAENEKQMASMAQTTSMLIIDKKKMRLKDANLPPIVLEQTPFYLKFSKIPVVKAKVGPKMMTLMCDPKVYEIMPIKKEVKAVVSGIYITGVKGLRANKEAAAPVKKKWYNRFKK